MTEKEPRLGTVTKTERATKAPAKTEERPLEPTHGGTTTTIGRATGQEKTKVKESDHRRREKVKAMPRGRTMETGEHGRIKAKEEAKEKDLVEERKAKEKARHPTTPKVKTLERATHGDHPTKARTKDRVTKAEKQSDLQHREKKEAKEARKEIKEERKEPRLAKTAPPHPHKMTNPKISDHKTAARTNGNTVSAERKLALTNTMHKQNDDVVNSRSTTRL